ncbi:MAG: hypothetical protein JNL42_05705 [Anaerolineae bacterium]|nr:hypothetical protein [Anaerolineae bacterium]
MSDPTLAVQSRAHAELFWHMPGKVMCLRITGDYTLEHSREINATLTDELDQCHDELVLLIDAAAMNRPYHFDQIRTSQTYRDHPRLKHIYVATKDRLVKLALMIIFNISRAHLHVCDDVNAAEIQIDQHLQRRRSRPSSLS